MKFKKKEVHTHLFNIILMLNNSMFYLQICGEKKIHWSDGTGSWESMGELEDKKRLKNPPEFISHFTVYKFD